MTNEEILTDYMQKHYDDAALAALLAHAEDGKLSFNSCCCFIGIPTADHALRSRHDQFNWHVEREETAAEAHAEAAFLRLSDSNLDTGEEADAERRAKLIPLIKLEMQRREALRNLTGELRELAEVLK